VFDFETTGLSADTSEAIQVAGKAYDPRTLDPVPVADGGEFCSLMRPLRPERLGDPDVQKALAVNRKTPDELLLAPDQQVVWTEFVAWVNRFNPKRSPFGAPIACGKNIRNFDLKFVEVLNRLHLPKAKRGKVLLFNDRQQVELEDLVFAWFEGSTDLPNVKMDTLRDYFGLSREGAHDALTDVRQTGQLIMKFLKLHRELRRRTCRDGSPLLTFRDSCRPAA
jgi:DNA polymerase III epsilon subunit-like protein